MASILLIVGALVLIAVLHFYSGTRKLPPGPWGIPFFGYSVFFDTSDIYGTYDKLQKRFGGVIGMRNGLNDIVLVCGWEAVQEALTNTDLDYRPRFLVSGELYPGEQKGMLLANGANWKAQRRFSLHHFRNFGFGKRSHETVITEEAEYLVDQLLMKNGQPVDVKVPVGVSSINILWAIIGGKRHDHSSPTLQRLVGLLYRGLRAGIMSGGLINAFPFLRHIAPGYFGCTEIWQAFGDIKEYVKESVKEHEDTYNPDEIRDFIDTYIQEMRKEEHDPSFVEMQMIALIGDFFTAGAETSSSLISFAIMFMCKYPHLQKKIQDQMDEIVGRGSMPTIDHRSRLVEVDAFLNECLRCRNPVGIAVPHYAQKTTTLQGHVIEQGTRVSISLHSVTMDKEYWGDPETFRPSRFITPEGTLRKDDRLIVFGKGRRSCLGEALARMTSYLIFSTLVHKIDFKFAPGENPNDKGLMGFTRSPENFNIIATPRN